MDDQFQLQCPIPLRDHPTVQMAHGGGGRFMRQLIESLFLPAFARSRVPLPACPAVRTTRLDKPGTMRSMVVAPALVPGANIRRMTVR